MSELLSNPRALIGLTCIVALVIGINLPLLSAFRNSKFLQEQVKILGHAIGSGAEIRKQRQEDLDELHRRVQELKSEPPKQEK